MSLAQELFTVNASKCLTLKDINSEVIQSIVYKTKIKLIIILQITIINK